MPRIGVVVVAAGSGTRLGAGAPKAFVGIDGSSILRHALTSVFAAPTAQVVIVAPAGREGDALSEALAAAGERRDLVSVVAGGETRQASVAAGLAALWADVEVVLVHDAARALTPAEVFERVIAAIDAGAAGAIPVLPVIDTVKRVVGHEIVAAVDRAELAAAQTPQGFRRDVLDAAYAAARVDFTDDAALVAEAGHAVAAVPGHPLAFKITTTADLDRARHLITEAFLTLPPIWSTGLSFPASAWAPTCTPSVATARSGSQASNGPERRRCRATPMGMPWRTRSSTPCSRRPAWATSARTSAPIIRSTPARTRTSS